MPDERGVLLSLRPRFAQAIVDGTKTVELRRTRPNVPEGSTVVLYSASPVKAVIGWARLAGVEQAAPGVLWQSVRSAAKVSRAEYETYFHGTEHAYALHLDYPVPLAPAVPLAQLRQLVGVSPPQSFRYLTPTQMGLLNLPLRGETCSDPASSCRDRWPALQTALRLILSFADRLTA